MSGYKNSITDINGNVGIGTASPSEKLDVYGNIKLGTTANSNILNRSETHWIQYNGGAATNDTFVRVASVNATGIGRTISFHTNTERRMRIDSGGDISFRGTSSNEAFYWDASASSLGIGTASPGAKLHINRSGVGEVIRFTDSVTDTGHLDIVSGGGCSLWAGGFLSFGAGGGASNTERMRITSGGDISFRDTSANEAFYWDASSGHLGINVTNPVEHLDVGGVMRAFGYESRSGTNGITQYTGDFFNIFWTGSSAQLYIDTASVGTITLTSDYRVKKNIETQNASAIERINALRPVKYEYADYENIFVADNIQREGFIAHEVAQIIPSAVEGEKDAENAFQSLKLDAMLSVAVKAIQEQQEIINELKARIETLENQ